MRIYLAAAWSRKLEILDIANDLISMGHTVTSRWLTQEDYPALTIGEYEEILQHNASNDIEDVVDSDAIVRFSDADEMVWPLAPAKLLSGARNFEFGLAYAYKKRLYVVGGKQNIFDRLSNVYHMKNVVELYEVMEMIAEFEEEQYGR